jgi:hypothetical protein
MGLDGALVDMVHWGFKGDMGMIVEQIKDEEYPDLTAGTRCYLRGTIMYADIEDPTHRWYSGRAIFRYLEGRTMLGGEFVMGAIFELVPDGSLCWCTPGAVFGRIMDNPVIPVSEESVDEAPVSASMVRPMITGMKKQIDNGIVVSRVKELLEDLRRGTKDAPMSTNTGCSGMSRDELSELAYSFEEYWWGVSAWIDRMDEVLGTELT